MMYLPFVAFWVLIIFARSEIGWKWSLFFVGLWTACLIGSMTLEAPAYAFVLVQAVIDIILILAVFKGDLSIGV